MQLFPELSIRKKISLSFYLLLAITFGTALVTYGIVWRVERQIEQVGLIDDFFNMTLELRRFEKNFFLYEQEKDYDENLSYGEKLKEILTGNLDTFRALAPVADVDRARETLDRYNHYMRQLQDKAAWRQWQELQENIRTTGKDLTDFAEITSRTQKQYIHTLLRTTRHILVISLCTLFLLSITMATFLGRRVVQSLKQLEEYTKKISQGNWLDIPVEGAEQELRSIFQAFNRMTHELKVRQIQLVQSEKLAAFGTLLAGVAHELNNPLSNISTSNQILAEEIESDDLDYKKDLVSQIDEQTDKASDIVRTLLEFSRSREFEKKEFELKKLITETIRLIRGQVPTTVDIIVEVPDDLVLVADKQRIQQVLLNLIKNAIDALAENGHIWIAARSSSVQREGIKEVEIMIEDDGPGILPENLKKIFDPFFTTKDVGKGSGLGLFIVHDIIAAHGGAIRVDSNPGQGTTFTIWLSNDKEKS